MIITRSVLLRMKNVPDKSCREIQNTHFVFCDLFFFENRAVYEIMWKESTAEPDELQMTIQRMRIACWINKAKNTHSEYVICIVLFHDNNSCTNKPQCYVISYVQLCIVNNGFVCLSHLHDAVSH